MLDQIPGLTLDEAQALYARHAGEADDDAIRVMAQVALVAKRKQAGWGRLRLEALRELGRFLIRKGHTRGRPAKTSTDEDKLYLADLGIQDHHLSADAKNVARVPQVDFDAYLAEEPEPTLAGLLRFRDHNSITVIAPDLPVSTASGSRSFLDTDKETSTIDWWTPPEVFEAMGWPQFDLDVCSPGPEVVDWIPASWHLTEKEDGLSSPWSGFVWMNAPYGERNGIQQWVTRFIEHGDGIALVPDFTSTNWWQTLAAAADAVLFVRPKIQFLPKRMAATNTLGSTLVAIGDRGVTALQHAEHYGRGVCLRRLIEV
jgi:hypothetical protein